MKKVRILCFLMIILVLLTVCVYVVAAKGMALYPDGIPGDCKDAGHEGWIKQIPLLAIPRHIRQ